MLAFAAIYFLADFMDLIDDFQQNRVPARVVVRYYAFHLFQIAFTVAPIAVLVGVLVTLGVLARNNEITAMKAGGISVYRVAMPVLGMGLVVEPAALRRCRSGCCRRPTRWRRQSAT